MNVELFGCTGAGKSTLVRALLATCEARRIEAGTADDFVLDQFRLARVPGRLPRTLSIDLCALAACVVAWPRRKELCRLAVRTIRDLPAVVSRPERLNLARNVLKKVGIHEIVASPLGRDRLVLVDEGTLHAAHNLFVHLAVPPRRDDVAAFARLVPLPDLAVYVSADAGTLVERTLRRGHRRIHEPSRASVERFIGRAVQTFDWLLGDLVSAQRLAPLDPANRLYARPGLVGSAPDALVELLRGDRR
jgi:hypothetical protein